MERQPNYNRIFITRTEREWQIIEERIRMISKSDLSAFLNSRISKLITEYKRCPESICPHWGEKIKIQQYVSPQFFDILNDISIKTKVAESTIVDRLIIEPLLHP